MSLVVGLGTAAFTAGGGGDAAPGPRITPPVEMYSVEHAITTGEVPFPAPTLDRVSPDPGLARVGERQLRPYMRGRKEQARAAPGGLATELCAIGDGRRPVVARRQDM